MPLQPGSRLGSYDVLGPLGAGGMGEVYRARDSQLGRVVALKTLPEAFAADPERVARFEREARILATLNHPNIATLYGIERQGGVLALVMELVEGDTLHEHLRRASPAGRGLALAEVVRIARQIIDALDAAHEKGVVHRDLKPANVKLTPDDVVKVLDFGLAKAIVAADADDHAAETRTLALADTQPNAVMGTAAYMSPEQARGLAVDRRTDIWAFGCVLFEMLAGRAAFARSTGSDTIAAVLTGEIDWTALPSNLPPAVRQLVGRCLERSTKARLRDIADARPYLDDAAAAPVASGTSAAAGPAPRAGVSRRALLTSSAAVGLLGAGIGSAFAGRGSEAAAVPSFQRLTFRRGLIRTARFGPDFQTVLYGALWDGDVCRVYTVRPESPESSPVASRPATPLAVSSTGELALALGTHMRGIMTYGTLARMPLAGGAPRELQDQVKYADWTPDGRELALVRRMDDRDVLEFPAGVPIAQPPAPRGFSFPRISPRGDAVAVFELDSADWLFGKVVIFDRSGARRAESAGYFNVFGLAWHGDEVWFTAADELPLLRNAVQAMHVSGSVRIVARVPGNTSLHDIAPDGRVLIARTEDRSGFSVRAPGEAVDRDLSWLDGPNVADLSSDGRRVLFFEGGVGGGPRGSIYIRDTDGSPAIRLGDGQAIALSPDGRWALARTASPHLDLIPTGAGSARRLELTGLALLDARWLRDGRRLIVRAQAGQGLPRLYAADVDGTAATAITPEGLRVDGAGWRASPDGTMVAVSTPNGPELFPVSGGSARRLPGAARGSGVVGWIESGLLVSDDPEAGGMVFRVNPSTGQRDPWADFRPTDPAGIMILNLATLVTTPDGRGYGYGWHRATSDLFLVRGWS
jgi:hypothetical protein